jgi:hypothetical protein
MSRNLCSKGRFLGEVVFMTHKPRPPVSVKGFPKPLLRPLPTLLAYANLKTPLNYENASAVRRQFTTHLRVFRAMLVLFARSAGLPPETTGRLLLKCDGLADKSESDLYEDIIGLLQDVQDLNEQYGDIMKAAAKDQGERLKDIFRDETGPRRLITVHNEETWKLAGDLNTKLINSCWYDSEGSHEKNGPIWLHTTDLIVLVPGQRSIRPDIEQAIVEANIPIIVLTGAGSKDDPQNMAALRTEHAYRTSQHTVLRRPFTPVRLYQAIDGCYLRHLAAQKIPTRSLEFVAS